jgi:hypothetical protein
MITVGALLVSSFDFVRTHIRMVLHWAVLLFVVGFAIQSLQLTGELRLPGQPIDPAQFWAVELPATLLGLIEFAMLFNAVNRAIVRPEQSRFAYLRLGMDEVRTVGLSLLLLFGLLISMLVGGIVLGLLAAAVASIAGAAAGTAVGVLAVGFVIAMLLATIFLLVGLIPMIPLTLSSGKIMIGPAWRLTRGHFWRLLGAGLLIGLIGFVLSMGLFALFAGSIITDIFRLTDPLAQARVAAFYVAQAQMGWPLRLLLNAVSSLVAAPLFALQCSFCVIATRALAESGGPSHSVTGGPWGAID